jgi:hypothetical protein
VHGVDPEFSYCFLPRVALNEAGEGAGLSSSGCVCRRQAVPLAVAGLIQPFEVRRSNANKIWRSEKRNFRSPHA